MRRSKNIEKLKKYLILNISISFINCLFNIEQIMGLK
jgi:hypothetical protein